MNDIQTTDKLKDSLLSQDKFSHYMQVATELAKSELVPKNMKGKPMDILLAMEMAYQIGLPLLQGLQAIAVINGKTCMYGDDLMAVVQAHKDYEWIKEEPLIKNEAIVGYKCSIKRKNHEVHESLFTLDDARKANLLGKSGVWQQYTNRMLQMRARGFALRNVFSDALRGIKPAEEVKDYAQDHEIIDIKTGEITNKSNTQKLLERIKPKKGVVDNESQDTISTHTVDKAHDSEHKDTVDQTMVVSDENILQLAENGKQKTGIDNTTNDYPSVTEQQLDAIDCLLHEKKLDAARISKALKHFNVKSFAQMNENQGKEMIGILNGMDS